MVVVEYVCRHSVTDVVQGGLVQRARRGRVRAEVGCGWVCRGVRGASTRPTGRVSAVPGSDMMGQANTVPGSAALKGGAPRKKLTLMRVTQDNKNAKKHTKTTPQRPSRPPNDPPKADS